MKIVNSVVFIVSTLLLLAGCNNAGSSGKVESPTVKNADNSKDSIALTKLVRQMYEWHEKIDHPLDFDVETNKPSDTLYSGINWDAYNKLLNTIVKSNYFDQQFITNYAAIATHIDSELQNGIKTWQVGELSPFGDDTNPWCNCQDTPQDNFWDILRITDLKIINDQATFSWTWGGGFMYKVKASGNNGIWKISYLEGFDPKNYK
ncbi:hypothetical protein A3860_26370 [Niastella vici]|uniref:DUF3828 domain-containing protein n=1 Tax=Niastella vici TaxID=1703345 RepID=A0A1V9FWZ9_9BACT|nr:hypothetical protein [Niastella vici]OQP62840.1 hypothetical protein A3860_26370 [Niastella vici]